MNNFPASFGWIGLGAMGFPMAEQLARKLPQGCTLHVYDIDPTATDRFLVEMNTLGLHHVFAAEDSKSIGEKAACVITIVPEGAHVKAVFLSPEVGLLAVPDISGKLFIDCSTIDIATSLSVGEAVLAHHSKWVGENGQLESAKKPCFYDAPVSGGTAGAKAGSLTIMVGADPEDGHFPLLKAILSTMGNNVYALGGPSLGLAAKLSNNYLSGLIALATSEAMNLGMRLGVDAHVLSRCFATSSGGSWVNSTVNPVPGVCPDAVTSKGYEGGFKVQLMKKDMGLAIDAAKQVNARVILGDVGLAAYAAASDDPRCRDKDSRVIYRWLGGIEPEVEAKK